MPRPATVGRLSLGVKPMPKRRDARRLASAVATALVALAVCCPLGAAEVADSVGEGRLLYRVHCAGCHGESGRGDGVASERLEEPPPDLSRIRERHAGEFPRAKVAEIIDGRRRSAAHGGRAMPVWGLTFQTPGLDSDQEGDVRGRITALTRYLETLQQPSSEP